MDAATPSPDEIETAIHRTLEEFKHGDHVTASAINRGECEAFAEAVTDRLDGELAVLTTADVVGGDREAKPEPWHVWLTDGDRHYDAEVPEGADSWGGLPFWSRTCTKTPSDLV